MKTVIALACVIFAGPSFAEAYKCKNNEGKFEYQGKPCANGEKINLNYPKQDDDPNLNDLAPDLLAKYGTLIAQKKIAVGMTASMVVKSWGKPHRTNLNYQHTGKSEQWIYDRGAYVFDVVYLDQGIVKSINVSK